MSKRKIRRTNQEIETDILEATQCVIKEYGFEKATIKAVALKSGTRENILYKRYNNIGDLIDKFIIGKYDSWIINPLFNSWRMDEHDEYRANKRFFKEIINDLYKDKVLRKLFAWELAEVNPTTQKTIKTRETLFSCIAENFTQSVKVNNPTLAKTLAVILGGIFYISLMKDKSTFWNIDFNTAKGKEELIQIVNDMIDSAFIGAKTSEDVFQIARNMKAKGLDNKTIADCTGLAISMVVNL